MSVTIERAVGTADGPMPVLEAIPDADPAGGILVLQEIFGLTPHIGAICARLAGAGWHAVAPALYHRHRPEPVAFDHGDMDGARKQQARLTAAGITADLDGALDYLGGAGFGPAARGVIGFCMGGSLALYAGTLRPLGAAVTYYGGGVTRGRFGLPPLTELAPALQSPWLGLYGDQDHTISVEEVEQLREASAGAAVPAEIIRYPQAGHGFNCDARPAAYDPSAAADAWQRTADWLAKHVG